MVCVSPPEPDDARLWAYLDGKDDPGLRAHLRQCAHCRERARALAAFEGRLATGLYRALCPTPQELGEYHLGLLPADQAAAVEQHLAGCPHCAREVAQLRTFLASPEPAREPAPGPLAQVRAQVRVLIAQLLAPGPGLAPAPVGIRGQEQASRTYRANGVEVVLGVQPDAERPDRSVILGLVIGLEAAGVVAHLWQEHRPIAAVAVDDLDSFVIPGVAPGVYELTLAGPQLEIVIQDLQIGARSSEAGHESERRP